MAEAAKTITIGCRLPSGLRIEKPNTPNKLGHLTPTNRKEVVLLRGANKARIVGADYGTTEVNADFWAAWKKANPTFPALESGAIFEAANADAAEAVATEVRAEKTGFEPMQTDGKDPRASGVKTAKPDDDE